MKLVSVLDYEESAKKRLSKNNYEYIRSGACAEYTLQWNRSDFQKISIRPVFLRDVSHRSMTCEILGAKLDMPVGIAPTMSHKMVHEDGELATAKAAGTMNTIYIMSTMANTSIDDIARAAPKTTKWLQLYLFKNRKINEDMIRKAEQHDFKAIVLTVSVPVSGIRYENMRNKFNVPPHIDYPNYPKIVDHLEPGIKSFVEVFGNVIVDPSITWDTVTWLVNFTKLPVILKGILTPEDALLAVQYGCKGIIISNHGGRQLDTVDSTINVLPSIVNAVGNKLLVMLDGGITQGTDVFKALALGAKMVFVGRPILWGITENGQKGVEDVLNILKNEFDSTMALSGTRNLAEITKDFVFKNHFCKL